MDIEQARKELRRIQHEHGSKISPEKSVTIGKIWNRALDAKINDYEPIITGIKEIIGI